MQIPSSAIDGLLEITDCTIVKLEQLIGSLTAGYVSVRFNDGSGSQDQTEEWLKHHEDALAAQKVLREAIINAGTPHTLSTISNARRG